MDLHSHPSPETFDVFEGEVTFFRITNGEQEALVCDEGTTVMIPPNALHALFNKSDNNAACWMSQLLPISISLIR